MGNYDISTETRELKIQWENVLLLAHDEREHKDEMPPPFDQIKFIAGGRYSGKKYARQENSESQ